MSKSPAFQFYPRDWLGDPEIMLMDWDARAMHLHFMCIAWMSTHACTVHDNDEMLMRWVGVTNREDWEKRLKPQIFSGWQLEDGKWVQKRLLREKTKQLEHSEKRKKAAAARWGNDAALHDAHALQVQCSSSSSSTSIKRPPKSPKGTRRAKSAQEGGSSEKRLNGQARTQIQNTRGPEQLSKVIARLGLGTAPAGMGFQEAKEWAIRKCQQ